MSEMTNRLANLLLIGIRYSDKFPYDSNRKKPLPHMRDVALSGDIITVDENTVYFELGNEEAEANRPYYHILEDAKYIRFPNRSTNKTRGSQADVSVEKRNYGQYQAKMGKGGTMVYSQEYRSRNLRGDRGATSKNYYENKHYHYIENILSILAPQIARSIDAKLSVIEDGMIDLDDVVGNGFGETKTDLVDAITGEIHY